MNNREKIFAISSSLKLAKLISNEYGLDLGKITLSRFSDGEFQPSFDDSVRGSRVFLIGSTYSPSDNMMELLLLIDAARRASAKHITAVIPYFGWARQDRKDKPRAPIGAKLVANILFVAGATRIITMDLHAEQIEGFFQMPVDHLFASNVFFPYIKSINLENLAIASPDMGGTKRANIYSKHLGCGMVVCYKYRKKANFVDGMDIIGDVKGKNVVIVDDMVDTCGTLAKSSQIMMDKGAKTVRAFATHAVLSGNAYETIENSILEELIVTDTIPMKKESNKIKVISCASLFAEVMRKVHNNESISSKFIL